MSKQMRLKWNDHTSNLIEYFDNVLTNEVFADVTLACEGLSLKAHKLVLSACSPFFKSLFLENPSKHPIVILKDIRFCDLKAVMKFVYCGEVSVSQDQLLSFLITAETLKVKGLEKITAENRHALGIGKQKNLNQPDLTVPTSPPHAQPAKKATRPSLKAKSKKAQTRKRRLTHSSSSDEEGITTKMKGRMSPDLEELSNDSVLDIASDKHSGSGPTSIFMVSLQSLDNVSRASKSCPSKQQASKLAKNVEESTEQSSNLLQPTQIAENASPFNKRSARHTPLSSTRGLSISRESLSSDSSSQIIVPDLNLQAPDSPPDIKPDISSLDILPTSPIAGPSHSSERSTIYTECSNNSLRSQSNNSKKDKSMAKKRVREKKKQFEELFPVTKMEPWKQVLHMCSDCSYTNGNIEELIRHIKFHKKSALQCTFCKKDFSKLLSSTSENYDGIECDVCNHIFCSQMTLLTHKLNHH